MPVNRSNNDPASCVVREKGLKDERGLAFCTWWLRPLLIQSGLQSVGNGAISTFARAFAPKVCETAVSRPRMTWTFLRDLSRAVSRFFRCPVAGNYLGYFSDPTGSNTITIRDRIGKKRFFPIQSGIVIIFDPVGSERYPR